MTIPIKIISEKNLKEKPNQEEVWDSIAIPWKEYRASPLLVVKEFLANKKGLVIDLGCGSGRNMIKLPGIRYYGVDFSRIQLEHTKKYIQKEKINAELFKSQANKLDKNIFRDEMFDFGLFIATLHCIEGEENRLKSLKEFYRVLKKGAEAVISVWNSDDKRFDIVGNSGGVYMSWKKDGIPYMRYYYLYKKDEFLKLLESVGFKILDIHEPIEHDRFSKKNLIVRVKKD